MTMTSQATRSSASRGAIFCGVAVALATLFDDRENVDAAATARHARRLVTEGVKAVVVCGTSGEADALSDDERLALLDAVQDEIGSDVPVIMGVGLPSRRQTVELTARAVQRSVAALLARSPRGTADCAGYYQALADAAGATPLLAYHFPTVAPPGIPIEELGQLPVAGIKDSSGSAERLLQTIDTFPGAVYVGSAVLALLAGALGCQGVILQLANAVPADCVAAFDGDSQAQRTLLLPHLRAKAHFPVGIKHLMAERYGTPRVTRMR